MIISLISKLERVKETLVCQRLFLAAKHDVVSGRIARASYRYLIGDLAIVESKIVWIQTRLSYLCSSLRSLIHHWDDDNGSFLLELRGGIKAVIEEISIPTEVSKHIVDHRGIEKLDPWFLRMRNLSESILSEIYAREVPFKHYTGTRPEMMNVEVQLQEIVAMVEQVKSVNLQDQKSVENVVSVIGKVEAIEFSKSWTDRYSRTRLN